MAGGCLTKVVATQGCLHLRWCRRKILLPIDCLEIAVKPLYQQKSSKRLLLGMRQKVRSFFSVGEKELCEAFGPPLRNVSCCTVAGAAKYTVQHPAAGEQGQSFEDLWGFSL